jgi:hypothetical protein
MNTSHCNAHGSPVQVVGGQQQPAPAAAPPLPRVGGGGGRNSKTSAFRGVAATENGQWRARIRYGKYTVHLGR